MTSRRWWRWHLRDSGSGEESDEDADEEGLETGAGETLPNGVGSYVAQMANVAPLLNA